MCKKIVAMFLSACMMFGVAACGAKSPSENGSGSKASVSETNKPSTSKTAGTKQEKPAEVIEIKLSSRWGGEEILSKYFNKKIEEFNASGKGIKIVADNITDEKQYFDKLSSQFGAGTQPNVFINYGASAIKDYVDSELLLDLSPYFEKDQAWKDSFLPLFEKWEVEGKTYGVPVMLYQILLYYNKDILSANQIEVPNTIEELEAACDKLVSAGVVPFQLGESSVFRAGHLLNNLSYKAYGGDISKKLASREMKYDSEEMKKMYATIQDWNQRGFFGANPLSVDNNGEKAAFLSGQSAFRYDGAWFVGEIKGQTVEGKADVTAFPYYADKADFKNHVQGGSGQGFSITDSGDEKINDAAVEVVKYLTSTEYYAGLEKESNGGIYPVKFTSLPDTQIDEMTKKIQGIVAEAKAFQGDMQEIDPEAHMLNTVRTALQGLFLDKTPDQCAQEIIDAQEVK